MGMGSVPGWKSISLMSPCLDSAKYVCLSPVGRCFLSVYMCIPVWGVTSKGGVYVCGRWGWVWHCTVTALIHAPEKSSVVMITLEHLQLHNTLFKHWLHLMALGISKQLPSGWPLITPGSHIAFLILDPINALHSGLGSFLPIFGGHRAFLRNLTSGWPWLTRAWPLTPAMHDALVMGSSHQIWWP